MTKQLKGFRLALMSLITLVILGFASCGEKTTGEKLIDAVNNGTDEQVAELAPKAYEERQNLNVKELIFLAGAYLNITGGEETPENIEHFKRSAECYNMALDKGKDEVEKVWEDETAGLDATSKSQVLMVKTALARIARDYK